MGKTRNGWQGHRLLNVPASRARRGAGAQPALAHDWLAEGTAVADGLGGRKGGKPKHQCHWEHNTLFSQCGRKKGGRASREGCCGVLRKMGDPRPAAGMQRRGRVVRGR